MSERGFIAVDRGIFDHGLFDEKHEFSRREAWLWLLCEAEWKPREKYVGSKKIGLDRGQLAHSVRFIAEAWGWHKSKVERFLGRLKTETMIETATETGATIITICNYDRYQSREEGKRDSKRGSSETTPRQPRDKPKEDNKPTNTTSNEVEVVVAREQIQIVVDAYSEMAAASGLPKIATVNDKRRSAIKARIEEHGLNGVLKAIEAIGRSDFCLGKIGSGWKADFDFLLQPSSMIKLIENKYDNRPQARPPPDGLARDAQGRVSMADYTSKILQEMEQRENDGCTIETSYERRDGNRAQQALPLARTEDRQP
ncbi:hypothetical protein G8E10_09490 [Rhizobiaceae bacterium CRRU44]|uniref:Uncharacterized protein n=1 Tax=Ferranicluibacter rubi TaxID=2715133 RepID=A0AA43ZDM5_9HYPH|nr:hypothetical protein [Ferranicluibacter rubi]NHT75912.1 hypothetical protein [Ferranicluibacter rubi]NHT75972.1 hypothetical protein [Ferranicluibacter rubi]